MGSRLRFEWADGWVSVFEADKEGPVIATIERRLDDGWWYIWPYPGNANVSPSTLTPALPGEVDRPKLEAMVESWLATENGTNPSGPMDVPPKRFDPNSFEAHLVDIFHRLGVLEAERKTASPPIRLTPASLGYHLHDNGTVEPFEDVIARLVEERNDARSDATLQRTRLAKLLHAMNKRLNGGHWFEKAEEITADDLDEDVVNEAVWMLGQLFGAILDDDVDTMAAALSGAGYVLGATGWTRDEADKPMPLTEAFRRLMVARLRVGDAPDAEETMVEALRAAGWWQEDGGWKVGGFGGQHFHSTEVAYAALLRLRLVSRVEDLRAADIITHDEAAGALGNQARLGIDDAREPPKDVAEVVREDVAEAPTPEQIEAYLSTSQWWIRDASADNIGAPGPAWRRRGLSALCYPYGPDPLEDLRCGEVVSDWEMRRRLSVANKASGTAEDPTHEQIEAYLRGSANWSLGSLSPGTWTKERSKSDAWHMVEPIGAPTHCVDFMARAEGVTPAEMRARILAASSTTAEDPDRLAKVAFQAARRTGGSDGFLTWEKSSECTRDVYRAIAAAAAEDRAALLARAEKAEGDLADAHGYIPEQLREPVRFHVRDVRALADEWQRRGEELEAVRKELATVRRQNDARRMAESGERIRHAPGLGARDTRAPF